MATGNLDVCDRALSFRRLFRRKSMMMTTMISTKSWTMKFRIGSRSSTTASVLSSSSKSETSGRPRARKRMHEPSPACVNVDSGSTDPCMLGEGPSNGSLALTRSNHKPGFRMSFAWLTDTSTCGKQRSFRLGWSGEGVRLVQMLTGVTLAGKNPKLALCVGGFMACRRRFRTA